MKVEEKSTVKTEKNLNTKEFVPLPEQTLPSETEKKSYVFKTILIVFFALIFFIFLIFTIYNMFNLNIISGVYIKNIDISNLSQSDARYELEKYFQQQLPEELTVKYEDFEAKISLSQIDASFDIKSAVPCAYFDS